MQKSLAVLKKELMNAQLQSKITKDVESKITKRPAGILADGADEGASRESLALSQMAKTS